MRVESSIYEIKGKELILRNPEESDAERLLSYLKTTSRETTLFNKRAGGDYPHPGRRKRIYQRAEQLRT